MPWKGIKDPYKIWLSEIILQQTRVIQGEKYYLAFIKKYQKIEDLANASETEVFRLWQGLGYYNRCRNMIHTAKTIVKKYKGEFPKTYEEIRELKGIGDYTASAIASFAYNLPHAVVDGNVVRVLSRVFGLKQNFYESSGRNFFHELALQLLPLNKSALYNQAIMDFGAIICKPANPLCDECPIATDCFAKKKNKVDEFPVKKEKKALKQRHFHFYVFYDKQYIYVTKRKDKDIWKDLYSFYMVETDTHQKPLSLEFPPSMLIEKSITLNQKLTHQQVFGYFNMVNISTNKVKLPKELIKLKKEAIIDLAFPGMIVSFFKKFDYL